MASGCPSAEQSSPEIHIVNNLLDTKILKLSIRDPGHIRKDSLDPMIISCCTVGCDRFRIGDVVLITDLYHLPAALYGYQEFTAQIGAVCIIIQWKAHRNRSPS